MGKLLTGAAAQKAKKPDDSSFQGIFTRSKITLLTRQLLLIPLIVFFTTQQPDIDTIFFAH